ncbi:MAG TPA: aminotransferase class III-fold pyridoxal phosphate-dependent enzyme [Steroidobacteraceae bacterium]|nr:aminotransferase class III-fold pyridoxal phosphate-dependent enzyme [Steroidobacteraceae bacterium]
MDGRQVSGTLDLEAALAEVEARYRARRPISAQRRLAAAEHMPGGNTRTVLHFSPFPIVFARGQGNRLTDVDGIEYLDLLGEYSAGLYGHSNPVIQAAIKQAVDDGTVLGGPNQYETGLAQAIRARFPSVDLLRFTNSGTEANLIALATVRALRPGRLRIMVFDGGYHGGVFNFRGRSAPLNAPFDWLIATYNDVEGVRAALHAHGDAIAAVLVEPMLGGGCIPGKPSFLAMLREECTARGIVLVFDEVMTSRLSPSGLQGLLGIRPDMTTFGKYLGAGSSFGAFGGQRELMERFDPNRPDALDHAGTFNNNVLSMAGGLAGLTRVFTPAEAVRINALGDRLRERLNALARARSARFQATGVGSLIGLHFSTHLLFRPEDADHAGTAANSAKRLLDTLFHLEMVDRGYYFGRRGYVSLSLPTTAADCENFAMAIDDFLARRGPLIASALS